MISNLGFPNYGETVDLDLKVPISGSSHGTIAGTLTVVSTWLSNPQGSRSEVFAVSGHGVTATFTSLGATNGTGAGASFTLGMSADGVIRLTNTQSGQQTIVMMSFNGVVGTGAL